MSILSAVVQAMLRRVVKKGFALLLVVIYGAITLASLIDVALYFYLYIKLFTLWNKLIFTIMLVRGGVPSTLRKELISIYGKQLKTLSFRNFLRSIGVFGR